MDQLKQELDQYSDVPFSFTTIRTNFELWKSIVVKYIPEIKNVVVREVRLKPDDYKMWYNNEVMRCRLATLSFDCVISTVMEIDYSHGVNMERYFLDMFRVSRYQFLWEVYCVAPMMSGIRYNIARLGGNYGEEFFRHIETLFRVDGMYDTQSVADFVYSVVVDGLNYQI